MPVPDRFSPRVLLRRVAGRMRLARGRCPSCSSQGARHARCRTCLAYEGPFPVSETTLLRWAWRFEGELRARGASAAAPRTPTLVPRALSRMLR